MLQFPNIKCFTNFLILKQLQIGVIRALKHLENWMYLYFKFQDWKADSQHLCIILRHPKLQSFQYYVQLNIYKGDF